VPFDIAFALDETERLAFIVALGTLAGREFDWAAMQWKEPP
jgi:hypothetical protein